MRRIISLFAIVFLSNMMLAQAPTAAWINEFHYDNTGGDINEFVEIVVNEGFIDLINFTLTLYNGNGGAKYASKTLDSFTKGSTQDGFTLYSFNFTVNGGSIQNGDPDGLAIDYNGTLIPGQFLSYEGTFTAVGGPADGLMSTDIGVSEGSSTPSGSSVGLTGTGTQYSDFTWTIFNGTATMGTVNGNQALPVELSSFSAGILGNGVKLNWRTETEVNNFGFEIERQVPLNPPEGGKQDIWTKVGFVEGHGNSNSPKVYSFIDENLPSGKYSYRLKQIDNDGSFEYSKIIEIEIGSPLNYVLSQNYPNPFNPSTTIKYQIPGNTNVKLTIFNLLGQEVAVLVNENQSAGVYTVNFDASDLSSGIYLYKLETGNFVKIRKMSLLK